MDDNNGNNKLDDDYSNNEPTIIGKNAKEIIEDIENKAENLSDTKIIDTYSINEKLSSETDSLDKSDIYNNIDDEDDFDDFDEDDFSVNNTENISSKESFEKKDSKPQVSEFNDTSNEYRNKKKYINWKKAKKPLFITLGSAVGVFAALYLACFFTLPTDTISNKVYIENLNVGGLTYETALASIQQTYMFENQEITLSCNGKSYSMDSLSIGLTASPEESAQKAFDYGKTGNKFLDAWTAMGLLFHKHVIVPVAVVDEAKLDEQINAFGKEIYGELQNPYIDIKDDGKCLVWSGETGYNNDPSKAREEIVSALKNENFKNIEVTLESAPPSALTIEEFDAAVYKDPVDAYYQVDGNTVNIVDEQSGRFINKEEATPIIENLKESSAPVEIPWYPAYAAVTAQSLKDKLFADTLGSYSTNYGGSTSNRCANVARAAELINGKVIAPGEVFSFNDTVGKRTKENGFYMAKEYSNGQTVDGIGGGTCQVSTTLYSAVLYADLGIVERSNHMFTVSYAPAGQDATVADSGVDFKFRNSTDYPIKVVASTDGSNITVSIVGTAWDPPREVKLSHSVSTSNGATTVYSTRSVYINGELAEKENLNSSYYKPHTTQ